MNYELIEKIAMTVIACAGVYYTLRERIVKLELKQKLDFERMMKIEAKQDAFRELVGELKVSISDLASSIKHLDNKIKI
jgi:hypothetical protein